MDLENSFIGEVKSLGIPLIFIVAAAVGVYIWLQILQARLLNLQIEQAKKDLGIK